MSERARVQVLVTVEIDVADPDVIERVTGPEGDEWRAHLYDLHTREDVLNHLALNCVQNGVMQASQLDGWADLSRQDSAEMHIADIEAWDGYALESS